MYVDWILRGGRVIDPASGTDEIRDLYILDGRLAEAEAESAECAPERVLDLRGLLVTPGLIDYHAHVFHTGSTIAVPPEKLAAQGTVSVVDAGTAGCANYEEFASDVIAGSVARVRAFLNIYSRGQEDGALLENFDPALYDVDGMAAVIEKHRDQILGLKLRLSRGIVPEERAAEYLEACMDLAEVLEERTGKALRVCVHATDCPIPAGELARRLRPGDIFCHCYQGKGHSILTESGEIDPEVLAARERGILFDAANGRSNFCLDTARRAIAAGFLPDIISSDLTAFTFAVPPHVESLPHVLSKYLALGLPLAEVLRLCTQAHAKLLGDGESGSLKPGAAADIAVFRLEERTWEQRDFRDDAIVCGRLLVPQMTMIGGETVFRR